MKAVNALLLAWLPAAFACRGDGPTGPSRQSLSRFSGVWTGTISFTQAGACPFVGGSRAITMDWTVSDEGRVTIRERQTQANWTSGSIADDLRVTADRTDTAICGTTRHTYTAAYSGTIRGAGPHQVDLEGVETPCPPDCVFRVVYAMTKS